MTKTSVVMGVWNRQKTAPGRERTLIGDGKVRKFCFHALHASCFYFRKEKEITKNALESSTLGLQ
ncbi:MAG: hypothetical protein JWQ61_1550 [Collimonas fungivorans]|nr:hypothetical protein [Collimonas fungivorans]